jgi:hypothetical protein
MMFLKLKFDCLRLTPNVARESNLAERNTLGPCLRFGAVAIVEKLAKRGIFSVTAGEQLRF